jgi:hypothetical protein
VSISPEQVDVAKTAPTHLELKVIKLKMHLPSLLMLRAGHPVLTLRTVNVQADEFSEMAIIDNGVRLVSDTIVPTSLTVFQLGPNHPAIEPPISRLFSL